jgi:hypothetical protein
MKSDQFPIKGKLSVKGHITNLDQIFPFLQVML